MFPGLADRPVVAELAAAAVAAGVTGFLCRRAVRPGSAEHRDRWSRRNHADSPVTLREGPALVAGSSAGLVIRALSQPDRRRESLAVAVAVLGSGLVGGYDDLYGSGQAKGFRGHLAALRRGEVTSGMIKIAGVGASSLLGALINTTRINTVKIDTPGRSPRLGDVVVDVVIDTTVSAGTANLINLCDLRPGRAIKAGLVLALKLAALGVSGASGVPGASAGPGSRFAPAGPVLGAACGALPSDLAARSMLGDCGANALGAGLGTAAARSPRPVRVAVLIVVVGLNLISERYSFTALIEANPLLRRLDHLGRAR